MKNRKLYLLLILLGGSLSAFSQNAESKLEMEEYRFYTEQAAKVKSPVKEVAINSYRKRLAEQSRCTEKVDLEKVLLLLSENGTFADLDDKNVGKTSNGNDADRGGAVTEAYNRIWRIVEAFKKGDLQVKRDKQVWGSCLDAIWHYGMIEISRPNDWTRFHSSCFAIPTAAVNIYFNLLPQMDLVEQGKTQDKKLVATCEMLKTVGLQAWTRPCRGDKTDENVVQIERFRHHVWWVGGNALGYRPLLPVAFMFRSIPMIDLLAEVSQKAISATSQNTYYDSFWNEGFTVDGAGWGHGMQCLIWGYPIHGTSGALQILGMLKGSPWEQKLSRENVAALLNYFRGSNYYYYKGYTLPCLDRGSMNYQPNASVIGYRGMLSQLLNDWSDSFTLEELQEIKQLYTESQSKSIGMKEYGNWYNGARWFFNNDDLIKKNDRYHITVNMASIRCDGIESAPGFADCYNFYTTDGVTLFQKSGDEYRKALGAFDVTVFPGVTAREGMDKLTPVTNWRGYCSKYNFAAAATLGGENAVAGYIFEKMNASDKEGVNDHGDNQGRNAVLYGVKAYKSYFMLGDYMVALGAGITNKHPDLEGTIRTSIEQTTKTGKVYTYKGKEIEWVVQQDKFAYSVFPEYKQKTHYICETRKTDWVKMNRANQNKKSLPEEVDIFCMWIDHGQKPVNDTYGYVVYAGGGMPAKEYPFEVLRNDTLIQAVKSLDGKVLEAVFYDERTSLMYKDIQLSVSAPCTVLIEQKGGEKYIAVTDARMNKELDEIKVIWNEKEYWMKMPKDEWCGASVVCSISSNGRISN